MKNLDKFVAIFLIIFFLIYTYQSYSFELLPFEIKMLFKPDTLPKGISILGIIISLLVLVSSKKEENETDKDWKTFDFKALFFIIICMICYATLLKPLGFVVSTASFIIASAAILGERKWIKLFIISLIGALLIWLLVDKLLGIYLYPIPEFFKSFFNQ